MGKKNTRYTFVVSCWARIFEVLRVLSVFDVVRRIPWFNGSFAFVDAWVLGNFVLSVVLSLVSYTAGIRWWECLFMAYAALRVAEVTVYQVNVLLFDEYRAKKASKPYAVRSLRRVLVLSLHNYAEMIFWFALFYRNMGRALWQNGAAPAGYLDAIGRSLASMTGLGYTGSFPATVTSQATVLIQSVIGIFLSLMVIARFISLIPPPDSIDEFED